MTMYRVFPHPTTALDPTTPEGINALTEAYRPLGPSTVRVNMIVTPHGATVGADGTSGSLSNPTDRRVVRVIRSGADAVIIGAETLRREKIPLPTGCPLVVLSKSGVVPTDTVIPSPEGGELVVITPHPELAQAPIEGFSLRTIAVDSSSLTPENIVATCRAEGWNQLLIEGGQSVITQFVEADAIDELCLTLTGAPREDTSPPVAWWPRVADWETRHLYTDDNRMLYHRYSRVPKTAG